MGRWDGLAVKGSAAPPVGGTVMYAGKDQSAGPVGVEAYWSVGPTSYRRSRSGTHQPHE